MRARLRSTRSEVTNDSTILHVGALSIGIFLGVIGPGILFGQAAAAPRDATSLLVLAQEEESETTNQDTEEETGAEEGQTQESPAETGPPWTYQMAKILLALVLFMALGIGLLYYRMVVLRRQGRA